MADVVYTVGLNDREVLHQLRVIARAVDDVAAVGERDFKKLSDQMEKGFKRGGKSAKASGLQIGLVSGVVQQLTRDFIRMGERAARAFLEVIKGGVELAKELELTQIQLTNILGGNQEAALAFLEQTRQTAKRLRTDYVELAGLAATILPQANDIEQTNKLLESAVILGKQAGQNVTGIRIALQEALAGQFISLQRRLNVPASAVARIKALSEDIGLVNALVEVLGDRVDELGLDLDSISDTGAAAFATLQSEARQLQQIFGEPVLEELKEQAQALLETLDEHRDDIEAVAKAFGELVASVVEFIGTNLNEFLLSLDYEQLEKTADAFNDMVEAARLLADVLELLPETSDELDSTRALVDAISQSLVTAALAAATLKAAIEATPGLRITGGLLTKDYSTFARGLKQASQDGFFSQEKFNQSLEESIKLFMDYNKRIRENEENTRKRHEIVEQDTEATLEAAQAYLKMQEALKQLAEAESKAADAQDKINKEVEQAALEHQRKLIDISIDAERKRLEDAIKAAQKREDLARDNLDKIEDIYRKHSQDIDDAATDLARDEEDIARKAARRQVEQERDTARQRLSIETDFRRELQRIRDRFNDAAQDAERRNDAQAYLAAVRQRDRDIRDARRGRDESLEDAATRAQEQRQSLQEELQQEVEDAKIANQRKLEDLQLRLARELEEQRINYQRQLEEQAINEQRKAEERARAHQQELEDFNRKEAQRIQDLRASLSAEFELVKDFEAKKREVRVLEAERTVSQVNAIMARLNPFTSSVPQLTARQQRLGLQGGGPAYAGQPYVVGERGPELFVPQTNGTVVPNAALGPSVSSVSTIYNNQRSIAPTFNVAEDLFNNPQSRRKLQNFILGVVAGAV